MSRTMLGFVLLISLPTLGAGQSLDDHSQYYAFVAPGAFISEGAATMEFGGGAEWFVSDVLAMGVDGSTANYGLYNGSNAGANITQSVLSGASYSIYRPTGGGDIHVSNTRLIGAVSAEVTCVAVSRSNTFYENSCP